MSIKDKIADLTEQVAELEVKEPVKIDVSVDISALTEGENLSEEFKAKTATIFEAAVTSRVKAELEKLQEAADLEAEKQFEETAEALIESVDGYLNLMVEKWMNDNEIAINYGVKAEIFEGFVSGLKGLFEEHNIEIPDEKVDVLAAMQEQIDSISEELDAATALNVEINKSLSEMKRAEIVESSLSGLSDTDAEKMKTLTAELTFEGIESFKTKVQTIRESYFDKKQTSKTLTESIVTDTPVLVEEQVAVKPANAQMSPYVAFLNKTTSK